MSLRTRLSSLWRNLFQKDQVEQELSEEVQAYLEMLIDAKMKEGLEPDQARRAARIEMGGVEQVKESVREVRMGQALESMLRDLRYAARMLLKKPVFTVIAVTTLALGIGANTAIFSVLDAVILKPLPFAEPDRLYAIWEQPPTHPRNSVAPANFLDWKAHNNVFEQMAARSSRSFNLSEVDPPEKVAGLLISTNYFDTLGVQPAIGRTFAAGEDEPGTHRVAVITDRLWRTRFGAEGRLVGDTITLDGEKYTVIGVLQPDSNFDRDVPQVFAPLSFSPARINRSSHYLTVVGRLNTGVTVEQAQSNMEAIAAAIAEQFPETNKGWGVRLDPLREQLISPELQQTAILLFAAVCFVLLIACANLGNLMLVRAAARRKEISIRSALGASRFQLIRQLMTESLLLSLLGGAVGVILGAWLVNIFTALIPPGTLPAEASVGIDHRVLTFAASVTILTGVIFGLAPALQASRIDLNDIRETGRDSSISSRGRYISKFLIVSQIALALILLTGSGLLIRSLLHLQRTELGFQTDNVLTMHVSLPRTRYRSNEQIIAYYNQALERIGALPGVVRAGLVTDLPIVGWSYGIQFEIEGRPKAEAASRTFAHLQRVTPDYFATLAIPLVKGRSFTDQDNLNARPVVIINETFERRYFADEDPIGRQLSVGSNPAVSCEIVGVAGNVKVYGFGEKAPEENLELYRPFAAGPAAETFIAVRTSTPPMNLAGTIVKEIQSLDKDQPITRVQKMDDIISGTLSDERFNTLLISILAAIAVFVAAVGLYGVMSYVVAQGTREIGIRMALGAGRRDVMKLVIGQGVSLAFAGVSLGLIGAFLLTSSIESLLFGVSALDPITFTGVALLLIGVAILACCVPARRAMNVDPMVALKYE